MSDARPDLTVVLLNWNCWPATIRTLDAVEASSGVTLDVLVVDNGSTDESIPRLRERLGRERLVELPRNTGYAGGMNAGLRRWMENAGTPFGLILTKDAFVEPRTLRRLVEVMRGEPRCGVAGPLVVYSEEPSWQGAGGIIDARFASVRQLAEPASDDPYHVDWLDGCCLLVRREAIAQVGGFDDRYFIYFEETDLCTRMRRAGWSIMMVPDVAVRHPKEDGHPENYYYYMVRNRYLFWRNNFGLSWPRVSVSVAVDTVRAAGSYLLALSLPSRRARSRAARDVFVQQAQSAVSGTRHHLIGRYGQR